MRNTLVLLAALAFSTNAMAQILWDNDIAPDGVNGRAISPPVFPDIRVVDQFVIPKGEEWIIRDFHTNIVEDPDWIDGGVAEIYLYDDAGNSPGNLILNLTNLPFSKMSTGLIFFGREDFDYWIEDLNIPLGPGRYWIGSRYTNGGGAGTNYWLTSTGQPDGPDTSGWFALDGVNFMIEGDPVWDHAFTITGETTGGGPCPWDLDGSGDVGVSDFLDLLGQWGPCPGPPPGPLWDNDIVPNGENGRAISPPVFPDIRVVDQFVIPKGENWVIEDFHTNIIEDDGWVDGGVAEIYLYDDNANSPGNLILNLTNLPFTKMFTGQQFFGRDDFDYWIEDLNIPLGPGRYWIGSRYSNAGGAGSNYWMTSTGQPDGPDTSGWFALDGVNFMIEGDPVWDHAFTITGSIVGSPTGDCPADFDDSGDVGVSDFLELLGNWGPCP